jgi:hypothetical protein
MTRPVDAQATPHTVLDRLLEVESRLEARLAEARREADARVAAAQALAQERFGALEAELLAARTASDGSRAREVDLRVRALESARDAGLVRLDRIAREEVDGLARWMAAAVIEGVVSEAGR